MWGLGFRVRGLGFRGNRKVEAWVSEYELGEEASRRWTISGVTRRSS